MATPTVLMVSCTSSVDPQDIVQKLTGCEEHALTCPIAEGVHGYPWLLSNKYYTADVILCVAAPCVMGSLALSDSMEGLVIMVDDQLQSFKSAKSQWATIKEINPEVKILACKQFTKSPGVPKKAVLEWCLDNSFELVELEKPEDEEEEEEDGFGEEPYGVRRIISALHAHTWSNLEMKEDNGANLLRLQERFRDEDSGAEPAESAADRSNEGYVPLQTECDQDSSEREMTNQDTTDSTVNGTAEATTSASRTSGESERVTDVSGSSEEGCHGNGTDAQKQSAMSGASSLGSRAEGSVTAEKKKASAKPDRIDAMLNEDAQLFEALGNEDPGSESFEQLFSRMASMKEKASSLEGEERRRYAEKVAVAFWRAIGGDEEEIDGLDDDSD